MSDIDSRDQRRVVEHEHGLLRFLTRRGPALLGDVPPEPGALRRSKHWPLGFSAFDDRFSVGWPEPLEPRLRELGAPDACFVLAQLPDWGEVHPLTAS
jgi:hypothetical protein